MCFCIEKSERRRASTQELANSGYRTDQLGGVVEFHQKNKEEDKKNQE